ncbi:MAG: hypothetical protein N2Z82_12215 [Thermomicrobium sp.]|nr:hypothetical protein [Thermomicrobium sp.]
MQLQDSITTSRSSPESQEPTLWRETLIALSTLLALIWWVTVLPRLAAIAVPEDAASTALLPGTTVLPDPRVHTAGDWVVQTIGDERFVATRNEGDTLRFAFVGTRVALVVRTGPDAGPVLVRLWSETGSHGPAQVSETELDLGRASTGIDTIPLARGLVPGSHVVELRNLSTAELAAGAIVVGNEPGVWWAWLGPIALGIVASVWCFYRMWRALVRRLGWSFGDGER